MAWRTRAHRKLHRRPINRCGTASPGEPRIRRYADDLHQCAAIAPGEAWLFGSTRRPKMPEPSLSAPNRSADEPLNKSRRPQNRIRVSATSPPPVPEAKRCTARGPERPRSHALGQLVARRRTRRRALHRGDRPGWGWSSAPCSRPRPRQAPRYSRRLGGRASTAGARGARVLRRADGREKRAQGTPH